MLYSHLAKSYDALHRTEQENKIRLILDSFEIKKTDKILDVGCGTGLLLDYLCGFREYVGVDNSREMLSLAEKRKRKNTKFVLANAENLPFEDKSFDLAISITAIHNFSNPEKALDEIKRAAKRKAAISVLKKSKKFKDIVKLIKKKFVVGKMIDEDKDLIFISSIKNRLSRTSRFTRVSISSAQDYISRRAAPSRKEQPLPLMMF